MAKTERVHDGKRENSTGPANSVGLNTRQGLTLAPAQS